MQFIGFLLVILLLTGMAWLIVAALLHRVIPGGIPTALAAWLVSMIPLFVLGRTLAAGHHPSKWVRLLLFRPFWYAQLLMLGLAFGGGIIAVFAMPFGAAPEVGETATLALAAVLVAAGVAGYFGSRRLVVRRVPLAPRGLPPALHGLRIAQLSDLHVGPHTPRRQLARIAMAVRTASPHLIAYTGDQVDDHPADMDAFARAFAGLGAPLGAFAVPGNHDVYAGWAEVRRRTERIGIRVLVNEATRIEHAGAAFWLVGTGDPAGERMGRGPERAAPDLDRALSGVPRGAFTVVLAHNPALFPELARRGAGVVLSGHTHHGQLSIPSLRWSLASVFLEFAMGTCERDGAVLYVSPGANYWGIPFRLGAWPEVTIIELQSRGA